MNKIIMLGTGCGDTTFFYNTCFMIQNDSGNFLVDTGGSIDIIKRLEKQKISLGDIHHIFISHSHTDHILGLIWMLKKISVMLMRDELEEDINIYCNDDVYIAIKDILKHVLPKKLVDLIHANIKFHILEDNEVVEINGIEYTFFDVRDKSVKLYGFKGVIDNKTLTFLGDVTLNPELNDVVKNSDYVMHEAFCLDSEENIFHAYEKHHSTVKHACNIMNDLNVKNLILFHTEETHKNERKELYEAEGKKYFNGNVIVPDDMEEIEV